MKNSFSLLEIILTLIISSIVIIYSTLFIKELFFENRINQQLEIQKIDLLSTKIFFEKHKKEIEKFNYTNQNLYFENSLLLENVKEFSLKQSANKITIGGAASTHFGFANVLEAKDMQLKADGVNYSSSSNTVTIDGLKITATKETGDSTINIENDTTTLSAQMKNFADKFNELRATIENEIYSADASVDNKGALRDMLATIKNELFGTGSGDKSIFSFGFSLDEKSGDILFNQKDFEASIKNGTADLEALFAGTADKKGIATSMDELISTNGVTKSLLDYEINMLEREERLKKDKEAAETTLDNKYSVMAQQFASYGVMINQMESSFSGLKMLILQSQASR